MPSVGFGIERIGLAAATRPVAWLAAVLAVTVLAAFGLTRFQTEDSLGALFRSSTPEYKAFERLEGRFPASEYDLLLAISGPDLLSPQGLERLRLAHLDLQFVESVAGVTSMFSIRGREGPQSQAEPLFPAELPTGAAFDALLAEVLDNSLIAGRLLSTPAPGNEIALIIATLDPEDVAGIGTSAAIAAVRSAAEESLAGSGLDILVTGPAAMREEIRAASGRDRVLFNVAGFSVGLAICGLFLRRASLVLLAAVPPALSVMWSFGLLSLAGIAFSPLMNTIAPLIVVIAFSNSVHLVLAVRRELGAVGGATEAARRAVRSVGPACVLTALTTAAAVASLALTESEQIRNFAAAAATATLITFLAVLVVVPAGASLMFSGRGSKAMTPQSGAIDALSAACSALGRYVAAAPRTTVLVGVLLLALFAGAYFALEPRYRLSDAVPDGGESRTALAELDARLGGVIPIQVMIEWPSEGTGIDDRRAAMVGQVHRVLEAHPAVANVFSIATLGDAASASGAVERLSPALSARLVDPEGNAALVTGHVRDLEAADITAIVSDLQSNLDSVRADHPDAAITLSGLPVVSAGLAVRIMGELKLGLIIATLVVIGLIGLAFRSLTLMVLAILPNMIAIMATGALMYALDFGLNYPGLVAMTIAFGLAADDTIHLLNRLRQEDADQRDGATLRAMTRVGPALILTSLVLVLGLAVTAFSDLPPNRIFGTLCMATLTAALVGDLVLLPASVIATRRSPKVGLT